MLLFIIIVTNCTICNFLWEFKYKSMSSKKVLFTSHTANFQKFNRPFMRWFKERGYEVHYASAGGEKILDCDQQFIIPFARSPFKLANIRAYLELKKIINSNNYDIIHTHTPVGSVVTRLASKQARKNGSRVIYTAHGFHFFKGAPILNWIIYYQLEKILSRTMDVLITINNEDYKIAKRKFKTDAIKKVNGVGVDVGRFVPSSYEEKESLRKQYNYSSDDNIVLFVAEFTKNKNQQFLINALPIITKQIKNFKVIFAGTGTEFDKCTALVDDLGLKRSVAFFGYRKDIENLYAISDVLVSASNREGLPVNTLEAMATGLPVVCTRIRGHVDVIKDGVNGYLYAPGDQTTFIKKLQYLFSDKKLIKDIGSRNLEYVKKYSVDNAVKKMGEIYNLPKNDTCIGDGQPNILHILSTNRFSGAENVAVGLIRENGGVYCSPDGDIRKALKECDVKYIAVNKLTIGQMKSVIGSVRPDIIYAHDFRASLLMGCFYGKKYNVVSYIHQNPDWLDRASLRAFLYKMVMNNFKKIIVVSDNIGERKLFKGSIQNKVIVQYNKVEKTRVLELAGEHIEQEYDFCFVGRMQDIKQPELFVDLIARIKESKPNIKAVMVGDGVLYDQVIEKIQAMNVKKNIDMVGFQKNPYKYINASKILVIVSKSEGLPMVALEAICIGKCVLSYEYPTLRAIFKNRKDVITGMCEDFDDMQRKAITLIDDVIKYDKSVRYQSDSIRSLYEPKGLY